MANFFPNLWLFKRVEFVLFRVWFRITEIGLIISICSLSTMIEWYHIWIFSPPEWSYWNHQLKGIFSKSYTRWLSIDDKTQSAVPPLNNNRPLGGLMKQKFHSLNEKIMMTRGYGEGRSRKYLRYFYSKTKTVWFLGFVRWLQEAWTRIRLRCGWAERRCVEKLFWLRQYV